MDLSAQKFKKRKYAILVVVIFILFSSIVILYLSFGGKTPAFFLRNNSANKYSDSKVAPSMFNRFYNNSNVVAFGFENTPFSKVIINGYIEEYNLATNKIIIRVPNDKYPSGIKVEGSLIKNGKFLSLLIPKGQVQPTSEWMLRYLSEIDRYLIPRRQILVYWNQKNENYDFLIKQAKEKGYLDIGEIEKVAVGVFEND